MKGVIPNWHWNGSTCRWQISAWSDCFPSSSLFLLWRSGKSAWYFGPMRGETVVTKNKNKIYGHGKIKFTEILIQMVINWIYFIPFVSRVKNLPYSNVNDIITMITEPIIETCELLWILFAMVMQLPQSTRSKIILCV